MGETTPGPWTVRGVWPDRFGPADRSKPPDVWTVDPVMDEGGYDGLWYGGVISEADARLIAAAPMMYDYVVRRAETGDGEAIQILEDLRGVR